MLLSNRYKIVKKIGVGGCGEVFLAEDIHLPSKPKCVVKQFKPSTNNADAYQLIKEKFQKEAEILEILGQHDQIPQLYAFFEENGELYIVEQYIEGLTLKEKVELDGVFDENFVRDFLVCLLPVISFIHSHNIIHRDIKPDNIILRKEDGMPVLIDFGVVKDLEDTIVNNQLSNTQIISVGYTSPEQAIGFPIFASDLFSLGMTSIYMLKGKNPSVLINKQTGLLNFEIWRDTILNVGHDILEKVICKAIKQTVIDRFKTVKEMYDAAFFYEYIPAESKIIKQPKLLTPYMRKCKRNEGYPTDVEEWGFEKQDIFSYFFKHDILFSEADHARSITWEVINYQIIFSQYLHYHFLHSVQTNK